MLIILRYCDVALSIYRFTSSTLRQNPVVFLGDIKQLQSLGAGIPFQLGIERTIVSSSMNQILRQKNETLLGAVKTELTAKVTA